MANKCYSAIKSTCLVLSYLRQVRPRRLSSLFEVLLSVCVFVRLQREMDRLAVIDHRQQGSHVYRSAPIGLGELAAASSALPPSPPPWSMSMRSPVHLYVRGEGCREIFQILALCSRRRRRRIDAPQRKSAGLVSSLYSRLLTRPHYITIRFATKGHSPGT